MGRNFRELFLATMAAQLLVFTTGSYAAYFPPTAPELRGHGPALSPAAMCGYSCRSGGRYIPGPPSVCYERGLNYCGSSRDAVPGPMQRDHDSEGGYDEEGGADDGSDPAQAQAEQERQRAEEARRVDEERRRLEEERRRAEEEMRRRR
jgi:hypothetical protein